MADIFVLNYLIKTLATANGSGDWSVFKRKQSEEIDLTQADLENRNLAGYDLSKANLSGARFYNANLTGADLSGAQMSYADMRRADLANAFLNDSKMIGAILEGVNAVDTRFENAVMTGCKLEGAHLAGATFAGANLENALLRCANLKFADLTGATIKSVNVEEADLTNCKFDEDAKAGFQFFDRAIIDGKSKASSTPPALDESISEQDCFRILDLGQGATEEEVAKAYRKKVMQYHPDRVQHLGDKLQKVAEAEFHRVQKAHKAILATFEAPKGGVSSPTLRNAPSKPIKEFSLHDLLELSKSNPNNDRVFYNLGQKYLEQGMIERAVEAYNRALELNPKNELAAYGLKIARLSTTLQGDGSK